MTPFDEVRRTVTGHGLELVRAHPRRDRLHLDLRGPDRQRVIGQWIDDATEATRVADATPGRVERLGSRLVLQHDGADRRLPALADLVAGGAELVVHRPERRAVVRHQRGDGYVYTKVVRPRRTAELVRRVRAAAAVPGLSAPEVTQWDEAGGTIVLTTLPGQTLHDLLTGVVPAVVATEVGRAVRTLHSAATAPDGTTTHDLAAEVDATRALLDLARTHRALQPREALVVDRRIAAAAATIAALARPAAPSLLHRDLHDKQLLVDGASIGMLDVDTLGLGDPALDLGNLLAHLDLRVRQGWTQRETAAAVEQGVLNGYVPDDRTRAATAGYRALAAARLEALYAFRPGDLPGGGQPAK